MKKIFEEIIAVLFFTLCYLGIVLIIDGTKINNEHSLLFAFPLFAFIVILCKKM